MEQLRIIPSLEDLLPQRSTGLLGRFRVLGFPSTSSAGLGSFCSPALPVGGRGKESNLFSDSAGGTLQVQLSWYLISSDNPYVPWKRDGLSERVLLAEDS